MNGHPCVKRQDHAFTHPTPTPRSTILLLGSNLIHPLAGHAPTCDLTTVYITSRVSAGECAPPHASKDRPNPDPPARSHPACQSRTKRVHRVTAAPAPSYVGRVVHVAALRGQAVTGRVGCERRHSSLLAVARCLAGCVYSVTGCTADISRVESGVWWWHCPTCSSGDFPPTRGGEAHPPHSEVGTVRGHPPARADGDELTHGELASPASRLFGRVVD
jgi:hypothetical protein